MYPMRKRSDRRVATLATLPPLKSVGRRELARLAGAFDEVDVAAGTVLIREGRVGQHCYLVVEGEADVTIRGTSVARVGPGEFVGEMALVSGGFRSATVRAATPMHLLTAHQSVFRSLLENASVARAALIQMTDRLRRAESADSRV